MMGPSAEFGAGDGCGNGHVQTLGRVVLAVAGNEKATVHLGAYLGGDAIALVAHDDQTMGREGLGVDVCTVE